MFGFGRVKRVKPLPSADETARGTDYVHAVMAGMRIQSELTAQNWYLGKVFGAILEQLSTDYPQIAADEVGAVRQAYRSYVIGSGAGLPNFEMQRYLDTTDKLIAELSALREAFAKSGIDITQLCTPAAQGLLDHAALVDKLSG